MDRGPFQRQGRIDRGLRVLLKRTGVDPTALTSTAHTSRMTVVAARKVTTSGVFEELGDTRAHWKALVEGDAEPRTGKSMGGHTAETATDDVTLLGPAANDAKALQRELTEAADGQVSLAWRGLGRL